MAAGARVAIADINAGAAQAVAHRLGDRAVALAADVTEEAPVQAAIEHTVARFGPVRGDDRTTAPG